MNTVTKELIDANAPTNDDLKRLCEIADAIRATELFKELSTEVLKRVEKSINKVELHWEIQNAISSALAEGIHIGQRISEFHTLQLLQ